ncbi:MAG: septum formation initiator family protein [Gemmatimonadales bacterium]|nr:septum formation initiator family protein [Gemmatimonadales bacterium]
MTASRWLAIGVLAAAGVFALLGGEYSAFDYRKLQRETKAESLKVELLRRAIDSLKVVRTAVQQDPRVQERIAREKYGMIGKGEYVYKILPDSEP